MKKIIAFVLVLFICFSMSIAALAEDTSSNFLSVELGTRDLTQNQINDLSKQDISLISERSKKDVNYLLNKCEEDMNNAAMDLYRKENIPTNSLGSSYALESLLSTSITLGVDKTIYSCDTGNKGHDSIFISGTDEYYSSDGSKSKCWTSLIGSGTSWAYSAATIDVSGTGTQNAVIIFYGTYSGLTDPGLMGGSAGARLRMSVFDLTAGTEVAGNNVLDVNDSVDTISTYTGDTNTSVGVVLQGGHTYLLRYGVATSVSNYSPQMCTSNFYDDSYGIDMSFVKVDF